MTEKTSIKEKYLASRLKSLGLTKKHIECTMAIPDDFKFQRTDVFFIGVIKLLWIAQPKMSKDFP